MFVPHEPVGHIWLVSGYKDQKLEKEEFKGKRTQKALISTLRRREKETDNPIFIYYEDDRTPYGPVSAKDLVEMKVLSTPDRFLSRKFQKMEIDNKELFFKDLQSKEIEDNKIQVKSGFSTNKLPTKAELRKLNVI